MHNLKKLIAKIIDEEVAGYLYRHTKYKVHTCLSCGTTFKARTHYHFFCSRSCYSRYHRIPGFIKRIVNQRD